MDDSTQIMAIVGGICALLAALAWLADRRRHRRSNLDRVGWVPWTAVFFWTLTAAVVLLGLAERGWLGK